MEELIIKEREVKEALMNVINSSNLPAFILKSMLKEFYEQISKLEQQQYAQAKCNTVKNKKDDGGIK